MRHYELTADRNVFRNKRRQELEGKGSKIVYSWIRGEANFTERQKCQAQSFVVVPILVLIN